MNSGYSMRTKYRMNGSIRESKSKEELEEFFDKISTPIKRPGTAPNQRSNDGTLRTHWAHEDHAPPTTWGQLAAQVRRSINAMPVLAVGTCCSLS